MESSSSGTSAALILAQFRPAWCAQAYMRLARIPHHVENWSTPFAAAAGNLPSLRTSQSCIVPEEQVLRHLAEKFVDLDAKCGLSPGERALSLAYESLVRNDLSCAVEWARWCDDDHFRNVTRKRLLQAMPFPLNYGWVWFRRKQVMFRLENGPQHLATKAAVRRAAIHGYAALSALIGNKEWCLGKGPSSLDCIVFGHLMDALREPIAALITGRHPNLVAFCERLQRELFDQPSEEVIRICSTNPANANIFTQGEAFNTVYSHNALKLSGWDEDTAAAEEDQDLKARRLQEEKDAKETNKALLFAAGAVASYLVLSNMVAYLPAASQYSGDNDEEEDDDLDES